MTGVCQFPRLLRAVSRDAGRDRPSPLGGAAMGDEPTPASGLEESNGPTCEYLQMPGAADGLRLADEVEEREQAVCCCCTNKASGTVASPTPDVASLVSDGQLQGVSDLGTSG